MPYTHWCTKYSNAKWFANNLVNLKFKAFIVAEVAKGTTNSQVQDVDTLLKSEHNSFCNSTS